LPDFVQAIAFISYKLRDMQVTGFVLSRRVIIKAAAPTHILLMSWRGKSSGRPELPILILQILPFASEFFSLRVRRQTRSYETEQGVRQLIACGT
jgi:hypothetical protein